MYPLPILKPIYMKSGIKRVIWNTEFRWADYGVSYDPMTKNAYNLSVNFETVARMELDFDVSAYHRLEEQEKDQVVFYFIPRHMLLTEEK